MKEFVVQRKIDLHKHNGTLASLSMSVDPRFKLAYVNDLSERDKIKKNLLVYITEAYPLSLPSPSTSSKMKKRAQDVKLHEFLPSVGTTEGPNETLEQEIVRWFSTPTGFLDDHNDVFRWWATNYTHFRRIALAAKDLRAVPGGSVPSERAFSAAGRLVTPFRTSLYHDSIQAHVCLSNWFQYDDVSLDDMNDDNDSADPSFEVVDEHDEEDA